MSLSFDELFAMRLQIQDITTDEVIIIKRLKLLLLSSGMTTVEINNYLVLFYEYFGTTITLQEIQEINVNENSFLNFLLNNCLSPRNSSVGHFVLGVIDAHIEIIVFVLGVNLTE